MEVEEAAGAMSSGQLLNALGSDGEDATENPPRNSRHGFPKSDAEVACEYLSEAATPGATSLAENIKASSGQTKRPFDLSEIAHIGLPSFRGASKSNGASKSVDGTATPMPDGDIKLRNMTKFSLYETQTRYYLVGTDIQDKYYRLLKIDRTIPLQLNFSEDSVVYTKRQMHQLLETIEDGNRASGGMKLHCSPWAILGFIRFTEAYYMLVVTQRSQVAMIGGHYIYQIDATEIIPLTTTPLTGIMASRSPEESRYLTILGSLDLHRSFYFSNSYNISRTLQDNIAQSRQSPNTSGHSGKANFNDMFIWNHHLLAPALTLLKYPYEWCMPIIHGYVDQSSVNVFGRNIYVTLIARRSRYFAGARYLKRGVNDLGYVANDVETEQIVADLLTTSFHPSATRTLATPSYTSFVQHRGSIPLFWTQDTSRVSPKPGIELNFVDPYYSAAALHFDNLFERYGTPVTVLNLVKQRERTPRESKLLVEYQNAIRYLNQSLPQDKKIQYRAFDMNRANKTLGQDVIGTLEGIAEDLVNSCGFFHNGRSRDGKAQVQTGVTRSNCIDCLDRTNTAQFVIAKRALAQQLQALGVIAGDSLEYDSDACNLFAHMFNDHGDTLASQYGGSHLVNTTDSYRKINNWQSHSRDMLENLKRYYHNSFLDSQRQEAYNLFLGNYVHTQGQPMLWELSSDYYLHHTIPSAMSAVRRRNYINWYTPEYLQPSPATSPVSETVDEEKCDWWTEYYKPYMRSHLLRTFPYRMNSTIRYLPRESLSRTDPSPFAVRKPHHGSTDSLYERSLANDANVADSDSNKMITPLSVTSPPRLGANRSSSLQNWLHMHTENDASTRQVAEQIRQSPAFAEALPIAALSQSFAPADKAEKNTWTMRQFYENSLNPGVTEEESVEYERYLRHPTTIPLVGLHDDEVATKNSVALQEYLERREDADFELPPGRVEEYRAWLDVQAEPLSVLEEDVSKKRFKLYGKWLKGKSFFKQSKLDAEFTATAR